MTFDWTMVVLGLGFFLVATLYSSTGFGGGSSYLAILTFLPVDFKWLRLTALICNIAVVGVSLVLWNRKHKWDKKEMKGILTLVIFSIPLAYFFGTLNINPQLFYTILGVVLIIASIMMFKSSTFNNELKSKKKRTFQDSAFGGVLGALAGLVGIGGGIFLSPYLYLSKWASAHKIAIATTIFILLNSVAGVFGQLTQYDAKLDVYPILFLLLTVIIGSVIGNTLRLKKYSGETLRKVTAAVILIAGINVLRKSMIAL